MEKAIISGSRQLELLTKTQQKSEKRKKKTDHFPNYAPFSNISLIVPIVCRPSLVINDDSFTIKCKIKL